MTELLPGVRSYEIDTDRDRFFTFVASAS